MLRKFISKTFILLLIIIAVLAFFKDKWAKKFVTDFAQKNIAKDFKLEAISVMPNQIKLKKVAFTNNRYVFSADDIIVRYWFTKKLEPYLTTVRVAQASLSIKKAAMEELTREPAASAQTDTSIYGANAKKPFVLELKHIAVKLDHNDFTSSIDFSLLATIYDVGVIRINDMHVNSFSFKSNDFSLEQVTAKRIDKSMYVVNVPRAVFRTKEIRNLNIPIRLNGDRVIVEKSGNRFFGQDAFFEGSLDYSDYQNICFAVNFHRCSVEKILAALVGDDKITLEGYYGGKLLCCMDKGKIGDIEGYFYDTSGGVVNIKDNKSLGFLQTYLDQKSYNTLVDNLQNYRYNKAKFTLRKEKNDLILLMQFISEVLGERNLTVQIHDILGGGR